MNNNVPETEHDKDGEDEGDEWQGEANVVHRAERRLMLLETISHATVNSTVPGQ